MHKVIWLTGHSGVGKTTIANEMQKELDCIILDGDEMRECISHGLGLSRKDRREHNLRVAKLAKILSRQKTVVVSVIAPMRDVRKEIEQICSPVWIYIKRTMTEREGHFYEEPGDDYYVLDHDNMMVHQSVAKLKEYLTSERLGRL